jgi:hypothetical protein
MAVASGSSRTATASSALIVSKADDPDATLAELPLTTDEAGALSTLLGAPQLVAQLARNSGTSPASARVA